MRRISVLLLAALAASACADYDDVYRCKDDAQCIDPEAADGQQAQGRCIAGGCALPDASCPSGLRFDPSADGGRGDACTAPTTPIVESLFQSVPLRENQADAASLATLFGPGSAPYLAGWDGRALLFRWDGARFASLPAPEASDSLRAGAVVESKLFVAQSDRLFASGDSGASWSASEVPAISGLYHDGQQLWVLADGKIWLVGPGTPTPQVAFAPLGGRAVSLFGNGEHVMMLLLTPNGTGAVYRRDGATWVLVHEDVAPLTAGWLGADGTWLAAGASVLVRNGTHVEPGPPAAPRRLEGRSENDLWALGDGWNYLLHRTGPTWEQVTADPQATSYADLWVAQGAHPLVWVISNYLGGLTHRSRIFASGRP